MSDVLQKGISSISDLLYDHLGLSTIDVTNNVDRLNRFIKYFIRLNFKHDEQLLAQAEIERSKLLLIQPSLSLTKKRNELLILSFLHFVGYDVSFSFIHAVNLAQQGDLMSKREGYLLCSLFFKESHQLALLLINTILKDLQNPVAANECAALVAASQLVAIGNLPTILPHVVRKLNHKVSISRKKALQCLYAFVAKDASLVPRVEMHLFDCLKDVDPGVVWTAVELYLLIGKQNPRSYGHILMPVCKIIESIVDGKLSQAYDYHGNPSPWFLISLIRLLTLLSQGCHNSSDVTANVLQKILKQTKTSHRVGFAVLFEVIKSITMLDYIPEELFQQASESSRLFLLARSNFLRYSGIRLLSMLIPRQPSSALQFQSLIMDILNCSDPSLLHVVVDLLFVMANKSNKDFVCHKISDAINELKRDDPLVAKDVYQGLVDLTVKFSKDDPIWFVSQIFDIIKQTDKENISINFEPRIVVELLTNGVDDRATSLARKKAVELAEEQLQQMEHDLLSNNQWKIHHLSLQLLTEFNAYSKLSLNDLVSTLVALLPNVVTQFGEVILSCITILLTNDCFQMKQSLDVFNHQLIEPFIRLSLAELQALMSRKQSLLHSPPTKPTNQLEGLFLIMDIHTLQYLESGGAPNMRIQLGEDCKLIGEIKSGQDTCSIEVKNNMPVNTFDLTSKEENDLKFSGVDSGAAWSKSGYKEPSPSSQSKALIESSGKEIGTKDEDLTHLSQLFVSF